MSAGGISYGMLFGTVPPPRRMHSVPAIKGEDRNTERQRRIQAVLRAVQDGPKSIRGIAAELGYFSLGVVKHDITVLRACGLIAVAGKQGREFLWEAA